MCVLCFTNDDAFTHSLTDPLFVILPCHSFCCVVNKRMNDRKVSPEFAETSSLLTDDYALEVINDQISFYYGLAARFPVFVLSFKKVSTKSDNNNNSSSDDTHEAILCVERGKVALLVNALMFFMPNKNECGILTVRVVRKSPYLHSVATVNHSRTYFQSKVMECLLSQQQQQA